mgnify:CR=1 FL=1
MGAKRLKAIAVRGSKDINIARPDEYMELCNQVLEYIKVRNENPIAGVMAILAVATSLVVVASVATGIPRIAWLFENAPDEWD